MEFIPNKNFAENHLKSFIEKHILDYSKLRNFDYGPQNRNNISLFSPYISHRILFEFDIIKNILKKHSYVKVEKFIQEIFWRIYWKGWLELRPSVWNDFTSSLEATETDQNYIDAVNGNTNIKCFNEWVLELKKHNYLHNHTRMWFASIWIFTLKLPWQLGAKFFLENLLDGDSASNTLSWRWVAGLQTKGKHYLAKSWNIEKFTLNRFKNIYLNEKADAIIEDNLYELSKLTYSSSEKRSDSLIVFDTNLMIERYNKNYKNIYIVDLENEHRKIKLSENVINFKKKLIHDISSKYKNSKIVNQNEINNISKSVKEFDVIYPFIGENFDYLQRLEQSLQLNLNMILENEDLYCWQFSNKGYFNFKNNIPKILGKFVL
jgi:deoxyribodipyrimidine photo-lyase